MPPSDDEIPLTGGRVTVGIVRVGQTVRRPQKPSSDLMVRLLAHLEERSCPWAPRHLGVNAEGRDVLTFVEGDVPSNWGHFPSTQVGQAAMLLRMFHEATRGSALAGGAPVLLHNDPAPSNFVFQNGVPIALIDFDQLAPGAPLEDVGYMAWSWCVSSNAGRLPAPLQADQVRVLVDAYELDGAGRRGLVDAMIERQNRNIRFWKGQMETRAQTVASAPQIEEIIAWSRREIAYTNANRALFDDALR